MRLFLIISAALLASCGPEITTAPIPADLLVPCAGWTGNSPANGGQLVDAAFAEKRGREACNLKLKAISEIVAGPR